MKVVALAGRRVDAADTDRIRFPLSKSDLVEKRIDSLFRNLNPHVIVCSAACGADLLALKVARNLGVRRRIILPFDGEKFRSTSVVDRPGDWGKLFDSLCRESLVTSDLTVLSAAADNDEAYAEVTEYIIQEATRLADSSEPPVDFPGPRYEAPVAVLVWEGESRGADDETARFAELAKNRDFRTFNIDTLH